MDKYGSEQVQIWRRSFETPPPLAPKSSVNKIEGSIAEYLSTTRPFLSRVQEGLQAQHSGPAGILEELEYLHSAGLFEDLGPAEFEEYQQAVVALFLGQSLSSPQEALLDREGEFSEVRGESLKDTLARVKKWLRVEYLLWEDFHSVLVVAHGNSLRALVKMLEKMSNDQILKYNIPTGSPILYELHGLEVLEKQYAEDEAVMKERARQVAEQSAKSK